MADITSNYYIHSQPLKSITGKYIILSTYYTYTFTRSNILLTNHPLTFVITAGVVDGSTTYTSETINVDYTIQLEETFKGQQPFIDGSEHHGLIQSIINIINYIHVMIRKVI